MFCFSALPPPPPFATAADELRRSISSSMLSSSTFGRHGERPPAPPAPLPAVSSRPASSAPQQSAPPQAHPQSEPPLGRAAAEAHKSVPIAKRTNGFSVRPANGDGERVDGYRGAGREKPPPLSPDALTAFSNGDPEAKDRNRCVQYIR